MYTGFINKSLFTLELKKSMEKNHTIHTFLMTDFDFIFAEMAITKMLNSTDVQELVTIIVESDNCTTQYK